MQHESAGDFRLPSCWQRKATTPGEIAKLERRLTATETIDLGKLNVLIIDDEEPVREIIGLHLEDAGINRLNYAEDGQAALAAVENFGSDLDLILCDLRMPNMDGFEFVRQLRALPDQMNPQVPVLLVTGFGQSKNVYDAVRLGINGFVEKPFTKDELISKVRSALVPPIVDPHFLKQMMKAPPSVEAADLGAIDLNDNFFRSFFARIPRGVGSTFTPEQLNAIKLAFGARSWGKHPIEFRKSIPIPLFRSYVVFLAGRERRDDERLAREKALIPIKVGYLTAILVVIIGVLLGAAYGGKRFLGIDIFPGIDMLPDEKIEKLIDR